MISVFICDDEIVWIQKIADAVTEYQDISEWPLSIVCQTDSPITLLSQLREDCTKGGIYFLDIDLKTSINGLVLAQEIRTLDPNATLIFVTTHDELMAETFRLKLQALDYIVKDEGGLYLQIEQCLAHVEQHCAHREKGDLPVTLRLGNLHRTFQKDDIYYVCSVKGNHKIEIHTRIGTYIFADSLKALCVQLGENFLLCNRGLLVNANHVIGSDSKDKTLLLDNGEKCPCSVRLWPRMARRF